MVSATHLHAMLVHFPIALLMAGFLSEIISFLFKSKFFGKAALYFLILGTLGAITAYVAGSYAGEGIEDGPLKIPMGQHELFATITLILAIFTTVFRVSIFYLKYKRKWTLWIGIVLFVALAGAVSRTGYLGGQLVYSHGAGVQFALPDFTNTDTEN